MTEKEQIVARYEKASKSLKEAVDSKSRKLDHEKEFNMAYKEMVRIGIASKMKGKYMY